MRIKRTIDIFVFDATPDEFTELMREWEVIVGHAAEKMEPTSIECRMKIGDMLDDPLCVNLLHVSKPDAYKEAMDREHSR